MNRPRVAEACLDAEPDAEPESGLRQADTADIPAVTALINQAYQIEKFFVNGERTDQDEVRRLRDRGHFLVLDRAAGGLAACIYVTVAEQRGYFGMLSVAPDMQGHGLGRRLVAAAEAVCKARGCTAMDLQVVNLRTELPPWYRRLGYREHGTEPFSTDDVRLPCHFILMSKKLE